MSSTKVKVYNVAFIEYFRVIGTSPTNAVQAVFDNRGIRDGWSVDVKEEKEKPKK